MRRQPTNSQSPVPIVVLLSLSLLCAAHTAADVIDYGTAQRYPDSTFYAVKANGQNVHVYETDIVNPYVTVDSGYHYVHIASDEPVELEVSYLKSDFHGVLISPKRLGIPHTMTGGKSFKFTLTEHRAYFISCNSTVMAGSVWAKSRYILLVFFDRPEQNPPKPGDPGVINAQNYSSVSAALNACSYGGTVYFPSGTYPVSSQINYSKNNTTLYLAPGAVIDGTHYKDGGAWPHLYQPAVFKLTGTNQKIRGRGIIRAYGPPVFTFAAQNALIEDVICINRGYYYYGPSFSFWDSQDCTARNIKVLGIANNAADADGNRSASDGTRILGGRNLTYDGVSILCSDCAFDQNIDEGYWNDIHYLINALWTNCFAMAGGMNTCMKNGDVTDTCTGFKRIDCDARASGISSSGLAGRPMDLYYKNITLEQARGSIVSLGQMRPGGIVWRLPCSLDMTVENYTVYNIIPGSTVFTIMGRSVEEVNVHFINLVVAGQQIQSLSDLHAAGVVVHVEYANVTFAEGGDPVSAPAAPDSLSATPLSASRIALAWADNSDNEAQFKIDRRQSGTTTWARIAALGPDTTTHTDAGLPAETKFYYKVKAWNAAGGNSPYADVADATTPAALPPPAAPSGLTAAARSHSEIRLDWTDNASDEDGFRIERRQSGTTLWTQLAEPAANTSTHTDTGLPASTKFYYVVLAFRGSDSSDRSDSSDATTRPEPIEQGFAKGATWRYRIGTAEASVPAGAWRKPGFDDSAWASGAAPFGYGPLAYGTNLEAQMKGMHTGLFLRRTFITHHSSFITSLSLDIDFDDGCIVWINGTEVARLNMDGAPYQPVPFDAVSDGYVSAASENRTVTLRGGALPLLGTTNVIALQLLNAAAGSGDLLADLRLSVISEPLSVTEDADADGMPDAWEDTALAGLSDPSDLSDLSDPDNDGISNYGEWVAGTDPRSEIGNLKFEIRGSGAGVEVSFPTIVASGPGYERLTRHYQLQRCSGPAAYDWVPVPGYEDIAATGSPVSYQDTAPAGAGLCYRARVWLTE